MFFNNVSQGVLYFLHHQPVLLMLSYQVFNSNLCPKLLKDNFAS